MITLQFLAIGGLYCSTALLSHVFYLFFSPSSEIAISFFLVNNTDLLNLKVQVLFLPPLPLLLICLFCESHSTILFIY